MGISPEGEGDITTSKHILWHIGNKDNDNYSGGGGGGSWALQDSVAPDSTFQVGQDGYDEPGVILTFETSATS